MEKTTDNVSMAEKFVKAEIVSKKGNILYLQKELKKVNEQIEILNELRVKKPKNVTKRYSSEDEFLTYVDNEINKNQRRVIEIEDGIQNNQTEIEELSSLNQQGKQIALDKFIKENNVDGENIDNFMNNYFSMARLDARIRAKSVLEIMQLQDDISTYKVLTDANIDKISQFSDEDIKELTEKLKNDKEFQKLIDKTIRSKKFNKGLEIYGHIAEAGFVALIVSGFSGLVSSLFGIQNQATEIIKVVGLTGALTFNSAGVVALIGAALSDKILKKSKSIKSQISDKVSKAIQEF